MMAATYAALSGSHRGCHWVASPVLMHRRRVCPQAVRRARTTGCSLRRCALARRLPRRWRRLQRYLRARPPSPPRRAPPGSSARSSRRHQRVRGDARSSRPPRPRCGRRWRRRVRLWPQRPARCCTGSCSIQSSDSRLQHRRSSRRGSSQAWGPGSCIRQRRRLRQLFLPPPDRLRRLQQRGPPSSTATPPSCGVQVQHLRGRARSRRPSARHPLGTRSSASRTEAWSATLG